MRKQLALLTLLGLAVTAHAGPNNKQQQQQQQDQKRHVDLVIALDISGSMDGLIDSARQKLWDVVNLLAQAKPTPTLRVGLISYGSPAFPSQSGYVNIESDLTTDLDAIYSKLFALRTNGGDEYVARAVQTGTRQMKWSQDQNALKIIFVAGNEPANQDPQVAVETAVNEAKEKHIFVNTIYCGYETAGEAVGWRQVASLGGGKFAAIDQNHTVAIATPMDAELNRLSGELNKTYVAYGAEGGRRAANQAAQDKNAEGAGGMVAASRAMAKSSALYSNEEWDLVDAKKRGKKIADMPAAALPPAVAAMPAEKRDEYVAQKAKEREQIQKQIAETNAKREAFIKAERAKKAKPGAKALDDALGESIRTEAVQSGFALP
jgi:von Willebrand factor type A domain